MNIAVTPQTNTSIQTRAFGTSYFMLLRYDVFTIDQNIDRYVEEIDTIRDQFADLENGPDLLLEEINKNKGSASYHPRTTKRIYTLSQENFDDVRATNEDKRLIAMTYWLICKLDKVPSVLKFLLKGMRGGKSFDHQFLEDGARYTCVDTSAITAALCKKMEIEGDIVNDGIGSVLGFHHFYKTRSGRIIDVPFGLLESGFFYDASNHPKTYKIVFAFFKTLSRRVLRRIGIAN